jgi:carbon dioxide concentrating mechanism protein CcmN
MPLQPLHPVQTTYLQVSGTVIIDPSAAIAPGAILRAAPGSKIIIASGVCIGMGAIINAWNGTIEIAVGANLGPGVLVVGKGCIGANACIGGISTIFNTSVAPMAVIPAGSVLGDPSRQVELQAEEDVNFAASKPKPESIEPSSPTPETAPPESASDPQPTAVEENSPTIEAKVYGRVHVDRLLFTLFPQGQSLNQRSPEQE